MVRAFVVQFHPDVNVGERRIAGRAEHVRSGECTHFDSLEDLLQFMQDRIEADRAEARTVPPRAEECQQ